jgi:hypothetical protein
MAYSAWSVVAFEQPTAAKWNILGANDAVFNDAITGVSNILLRNNVPTANGSIGYDQTNKDLAVGDGSAGQLVHMGAWKAFTPVWSNFTIGFLELMVF